MIEEQLQSALALLKGNPVVAMGLVGVVVVLFYFKPKEMFKLVLFCLFIVVTYYFISMFAGTVFTGSKQKDQMIYKSKDLIGD